MDIKDQIRQYIENNYLDNALTLFIANAAGNQELVNEAATLRKSLSSLEREKRINTIDFGTYSRESAKITMALLDLLTQLPDAQTPQAVNPVRPAPQPSIPQPIPQPTATPAAPTRPYQVFISYAREDDAQVKKLKAHLRSMELDGLIKIWTDEEILTGDAWRDDIQQQIDKTDIMLLIMSPDFINSDFIQRVELKQALQRKVDGKSLVVPVYLRRVDLPEFLSRLQRTPRQTAVASAPDVDEAWYQVAQDIKKLIKAKFETNQ